MIATTKSYFRIAKTHPNFFWLLLTSAIATFLLSLSMVTSPEYYTLSVWDSAKAVIPMSGWAIIGFTAVALKLVGLAFTIPRVIRLGSCIALFFYLSIGLCLAVTYIEYMPLYAPTGPIVWTFIGILHFLMVLEPYNNPANRGDNAVIR